MRYMLDTNICIYAIKHKPEKAFKRLQEHDPSEICISSVTYAELVLISVLRRQRVSHCKCFNHGFKKLNLQSALDCQLVILLERRGRFDGQLCLSHFFRSAKSSSRSL